MHRPLPLLRFAVITVLLTPAIAGCHGPADNANPLLAHLNKASWSMTDSGGAAEAGLRPLTGGDGTLIATQAGGAYCATPQDDKGKPSYYMYVKLVSDSGQSAPSQPADRGADAAKRPLYAVVEYYDGGGDQTLDLEYDSMAGNDGAAKYRAAEKRQGGNCSGTHQWMKALYRLDQPRFAGGENLGADFRLKTLHLYVRSITLTHTQPEGWDASK